MVENVAIATFKKYALNFIYLVNPDNMIVLKKKYECLETVYVSSRLSLMYASVLLSEKHFNVIISSIFNENDYTLRALIWFDVVDFYFTCIPMQ